MPRFSTEKTRRRNGGVGDDQLFMHPGGKKEISVAITSLTGSGRTGRNNSGGTSVVNLGVWLSEQLVRCALVYVG